MPRQRRKLAESKTYHVMLRGNEKKLIFLEEEDKERFINIISEKKKTGSFKLYAYCLMDNHVHLLINEEQDQLATIMKKITVTYVYYFNRKYSRVGHLFHDRFKSEVIDIDNYLLAAIRYIHNNPVKAGIAKNVESYRWSSYNFYISSKTSISNIIDNEMILGMYSKDNKKALESFINYNKEESNHSFVEYQEKGSREKEIKGIEKALTYTNDYLGKYSINIEDLKLRENTNIRNEIVLVLKSKSTLSVRQIAEILCLDRNIIQRIK